MKDLNLTRLNTSSPYSFWRDGEIYYLKTDFDIVYAVSFDQETVRGYDTYWFNLANTSDKPSPNDKKLMLSIISVIEEFFNNNPDILLYICDTANGQQAQRDRLFLRWFHGYKQQQKFCLQTTTIMDEDEANYLAMIVQKSNPHLNDILKMFKEETTMFKENK